MRRTLSLLIAVFAALALLIPAAGAADTTSVPAGATALEGGGYAETLGQPSPDWYTPELHERVIAAGSEGVALPADADVPASALAWTGIRPGSWMFAPSWCTMNFVFGGDAGTSGTKVKGNGNGNGKQKLSATSTSSGSGWYIGTAGHCAEVGDEVVLLAAPGLLMNIGRTVKSYDAGIGKDFALIEIYPSMVQYVNPSMAIIGGPQGVKNPAFGDPILHVGHGLGVGTGGTPRAGVVTYTGRGDNSSATAYGWDGVANLGDSGSGVRHADGRAVGNLTHLVVGTHYLPAFIAGTTAPYMEQLAGQKICNGSLVASPLPQPTCNQ